MVERQEHHFLRTKQRIISWILTALVVSGAILMFMPFLWMFLTSLKRPEEILRVPLTFLPDHFFNSTKLF